MWLTWSHYNSLVFLDSAGAGHGGRGGTGVVSSVPGLAYGSVNQPQSHGSGSLSGTGGGIVKIVAKSLTLDGLITANGQHSQQNHTGGASGGSIWLDTKRLSGNGEATVLGGNGKSYGGGGGGGRISVSFYNNSFSGSFRAYGGSSK